LFPPLIEMTKRSRRLSVVFPLISSEFCYFWSQNITPHPRRGEKNMLENTHPHLYLYQKVLIQIINGCIRIIPVQYGHWNFNITDIRNKRRIRHVYCPFSQKDKHRKRHLRIERFCRISITHSILHC
jgi:hypothetical protein